MVSLNLKIKLYINLLFVLIETKKTKMNHHLSILNNNESKTSFQESSAQKFKKKSFVSEFAERRCSEEGRWEGKHGATSANGWTNYTNCFTPEVRELMRKLGSDNEVHKIAALDS